MVTTALATASGGSAPPRTPANELAAWSRVALERVLLPEPGGELRGLFQGLLGAAGSAQAVDHCEPFVDGVRHSVELLAHLRWQDLRDRARDADAARHLVADLLDAARLGLVQRPIALGLSRINPLQHLAGTVRAGAAGAEVEAENGAKDAAHQLRELLDPGQRQHGKRDEGNRCEHDEERQQRAHGAFRHPRRVLGEKRDVATLPAGGEEALLEAREIEEHAAGRDHHEREGDRHRQPGRRADLARQPVTYLLSRGVSQGQTEGADERGAGEQARAGAHRGKIHRRIKVLQLIREANAFVNLFRDSDV
jgi:hypothetical protein